MKAATMIAVEKNTARSICRALISSSRSRSVQGGTAPVGIGSPPLFRQLTQQRLSPRRSGLTIPVDVLHENHRRIDDDAEIDRTDRKQVRILVAQHQNDDAEEQRERDIGADDERAAQVAEKHPLNEKDQRAPEHEIVQHGRRGNADQGGAIVEGHKLDAGRQCPVAVDLVDFRSHARDDVVGMQRAVHDDDRRDDVVFLVAAGLAKARHVADRNLGHVADKHRYTVGLPKQDGLDVLHPVALRQIGGASAVHETDAPNVDRLLTDIDGPPADIDIRIADRGDDLRQGDLIGLEFARIDINVVFLGRATPGIDLHDSRDG